MIESHQKWATEANMSLEEWHKTIKLNEKDIGWVIMSIGMAIGAGIVFLPVQVGLMGLWVFLLSSIIGYPAMYLFQRLFINTLVESKECKDYPSVIEEYLGKNAGILLGLLYFIMLIIWMFVYSTAITRDSASYLYTFGLTGILLSNTLWYGLVLICCLVLIASIAEKLLFRISGFMVLTKFGVIAILGISMVVFWQIANIGVLPPIKELIKNAIITLPFTLTSILFIQTLSPMTISFRKEETNIVVAKYKTLRAMNIAFIALFVTVFFYAVSFTLAMGYENAVKAYEQNVSALAIAAQFLNKPWITSLGVVLNLFAVATAFFGVFLGFREACQGIIINLLTRFINKDSINEKKLSIFIMILGVLLSWGVITLNVPVLSFTSICSPIFGMIGCLIPAYLVYKVPALYKYKGCSLYLIIFTGILLCVSPFLAFM